MSNIRQLGIAWKMYATDYDDVCMKMNYGGVNWYGNLRGNSVLDPYVKIKTLADPSLKEYKINGVNSWVGYGYNKKFLTKEDVTLENISNPSQIVIFGSVIGLFNVNGGYELFPVPYLNPPSSRYPTLHGRFKNYGVILFGDGHVKSLKVHYFKDDIFKRYNIGDLDMDKKILTDEYFNIF
jgi:prepilin-type processing-associated H-X9-DG protein